MTGPTVRAGSTIGQASTPGETSAVGAAAAAAAASFVGACCATLEDFVARVARLHDDRAAPFHAPSWIDAWYRSFGAEPGCAPRWVAVRRRGAPAGEADVALLPLVARRQGAFSVVAFADGGVVDYAVPLLGPGWPHGLAPADAAAALWRALRQALRGDDAVVVHKLLPRLPPEAGGAVNPLASVLHTRPCAMFGNEFVVGTAAPVGAAAGDAEADAREAGEAGGDRAADPDAAWLAWRRTLDKRTRKEIERCWRVFQRSPVARVEVAADVPRALALLTVLEQQQRERLQALGVPYRLDTPACRDFHRRVIAGGLHGAEPAGPVVVSALCDGEHVVSVLFGLTNGQRYFGLRQSLGGDAWKACSPARLLDEATARHLHAEGRTRFDFGIGDYPHKQALRMTAIPLLDGARALSPRGRAVVAAWRLRGWLRAQPALRRAVRRWRGGADDR